MKGIYAVLLSAVVVFSVTPIAAHHSFAAEYDEQKPVTLKGTLTKVEWVNPHGWIHIDVKGADGKVENWAIETGAPNALVRRGMRKSDFPVGLAVTVVGFRAKNGTLTANGRTVTTPDGKSFYAGSSGGDVPKDGAGR